MKWNQFENYSKSAAYNAKLVNSFFILINLAALQNGETKVTIETKESFN